MTKTANYIQRGESIDYLNTTEELIPAGAVVLLGSRIGVAGGEIPAGSVGALHMEGVFEIQKKAGVALAAGDEIVFTNEDGVDKAADKSMGYAVRASGSDEATATVKLLG